MERVHLSPVTAHEPIISLKRSQLFDSSFERLAALLQKKWSGEVFRVLLTKVMKVLELFAEGLSHFLPIGAVCIYLFRDSYAKLNQEEKSCGRTTSSQALSADGNLHSHNQCVLLC